MSKLLVYIFLFCCTTLTAQLDLNLTQSESVCSSDGSITAQANGGTEPYQYRISNGPELRGFQSSGTFLALQPGIYDVEVRDASFDVFTASIEVLGSYTLPSLYVAITPPSCSTSTDGEVVLNGSDGNLIGTTAFPTYKYRIVDLSTTPQTIIQEQNSDTFTNLSEGTYTFQIEDGCQNTVSETVTISAPSIEALDGAIDFIEKAGCDTYEAEYSSYGRGVYPHNITVTEDGTGTVIFSGSVGSDTSYPIGTNYDFGTAYTANIVDACGQTERINFAYSADIDMWRQKSLDCSGNTSFFVFASLASNSVQEKSVLVPATLTLTNQTDASDVLVYTFTDPDDLEAEISQTDIMLGATYDVTLEDSCSTSLSTTLTFDPIAPTVFEATVRPERGCMDGTTGMSFRVRNGGTNYGRVTILSGPASFTSESGVVTTYSYPRVFENMSNSSVFPVAFPPGNYEAEISDGCESGNVTFEILPSETVQHDFTLDFLQSCGNSNTLIINPNEIKASGSSFYTNVNVVNSDTGSTVFRESISFFTEGTPVSVPNLPPGNYQLFLEFQSGGSCSSALPFTCPCEPQTVDINIPVYVSTSFENIVGYTCTEGSGVILAEGSNGVAPYQYEIIDSSIPANIGRTSTDGIFTGTDEGTYTIRITDSCGNSADGAFEVTPYVPDLVSNCDATGTRVTLMANPVPDAVFTWIDSMGTTVQQGTSNELVFDPFDASQAGEYTLQVAVPGLSCTVYDGSVTIPDSPCQASIDVSKTVESGPVYNSATDEYTVTYRITADNSGGLAGVYDVVDTFILGIGYTLNSATLAYGGESDGVDGTILSPFNSGDQIITSESIAGLRAESWLVTAIFSVDKSIVDPTQNCSNGGGFRNDITATGDTDTSNNSACVPAAIGNLDITKDGVYVDSDSNGLTNTGDTINYTFLVVNTGNEIISNVMVSDPLLGGAISGPASGDTNGDGALDVTETWVYNASYSITQADIDNGQVNNLATASGEDSNGINVEGTSTDPTPCATCTIDPLCVDCTMTALPNTLDIAVAKTVNLDIVEIEDEIFFTISATNNGAVTANNIRILEILPNGFEYITHITSLGNYSSATGVWDIPTLGNSQTANLNIQARVVDGTDYVNTARLTGLDETDIDPSNDEASVEVGIRGITITKDGVYVDSDADGTTNVGDSVAYTFSVTNTGTVELANIVVSDPLLGGDVTALPSGDVNGDGLLNTSETWVYTASYAITQTDIDNGQVNNLASVAGEDSNGMVTTNTSTDPTPCTSCIVDTSCMDCTLTELPISYVDLALSKSVDANSAAVGDEVNFTMTARNIGTASASNISITERIPNGYSYIEHTTTAGVYNVASALWDVETLSSGQSAELNIRVRVVEATDYLNIIRLIYVDQPDTDVSNDEASAQVEIDEPVCPINIFNVITPNGDGAHDVFQIACIENYPNNRLMIYNRWGIKVYEQEGYANTWTGISDGRSTYERDELLPVGTYYYVLDLGDGSQSRAGYLYLTR